MPARRIQDDLLRRKRALHLEIGRSRRRMDARWRATEASGRRLLSWRTYVVRYPGWAVTAALGAGMAASTMFRPARVSRWLGRSLMQSALGGFQYQIWNELQRIWQGTDSDPTA